jgi:hypothetical protein
MPSERIANNIKNSLAPGELYEDFAYMFDTVLDMRAPYNSDAVLNEQVTGRLLCVLFPDKPSQYVKSMQTFRLEFTGIANAPDLQKQFATRVTQEALTVKTPADIVWRADQYFVVVAEAQGYEEVRSV